MTDNALSWQAEHLRITFFSSEAWAIKEDIFEDVFAVAVEESSSIAKTGELSLGGIWTGYKVEIKQTINRLDFILLMPSDDGVTNFVIDALNVFESFVKVVSNWVEQYKEKPILRIAVGFPGFLPVASAEEAYAELKRKVRLIAIEFGRMSELNFQVNLPQNSKIAPQLKLNRISVWAAVVFRVHTLDASRLGGNINPGLTLEEHFLRAALDLSTPVGWSENLENRSSLLNELADNVRNFLLNGIE